MESSGVDGMLRFLGHGRGGWLVVAALAAYILAANGQGWVPLGPGVDYWPAWTFLALAGLAAGTAAARFLRPASPWLRPVEAMAILALAAMVLTDLAMTYQPLRDLGIYLKAGHHFMDGAPVYLQSVVTARPADLTDLPFLYPPPTLPVFALLALLPVGLVQAAWVTGSSLLAAAALRLFGIRGAWLPLAFLWPPLFQGLWVGNVAPAALILFALGPWFGAALVLGAVFKSYTGIAALWLLRERRWRDALLGLALLVALAAAALPLTGIDQWRAWIGGLQRYQESQQALDSLYGFGLPRFVPAWVWAALAAAAVLAALRRGGREGLARLGSATIVCSPSLWGHGFLLAVPSLLGLGTTWLWLGLGITSAPNGLQWWWAIVLIVASWLAPALRREMPAAGATAAGEVDSAPAALDTGSARSLRPVRAGPTDWLDPLRRRDGPWPDANAAAAERDPAR